MTPRGSCQNRRFGETYGLRHQDEKISDLGTTLAGTSNIVLSLLILYTLMMEEIIFSQTSLPARATRRNIPEDDILHSHGHDNLKSYIALTGWALKQRSSMSPVRYELGFYSPEDGILRSHRRENVKPSIALTGWAL
jgi:hypothetical protein